MRGGLTVIAHEIGCVGNCEDCTRYFIPMPDSKRTVREDKPTEPMAEPRRRRSLEDKQSEMRGRKREE